MLRIRAHDPEVYHSHIDGLRAFAVLSVVINHLNVDFLPGGFVGVDIFFVISGYLITGMLKKDFESKTFSFFSFYDRRLRRIFPSLFVVIFFTIIFSYFIFLPSDFLLTIKSSISTLFFLSNFYFWKELQAGYFATIDSSLATFVHTWSLAVEEQFYIFFPIFLFLLYKTNFKKLTYVLCVIFIISLLLSEYFLKNHSVAVFFLSPFRVWELLAGSLLAYNLFPQIRSNYLRELFCLLGILLILFSVIFLDPLIYNFPGLIALLPVLGAVTIIHSGISGSSFFVNLFKFQPLVYIGLISYSLYLWHWPVIVLGKYIIFPNEPSESILFLFFLISIFLSIISYHFVEQPFRGKIGRKNFSSSFIFISSIFITVFFSIILSYGILNNGFEKRFSNEIIYYDKQRLPGQEDYKKCDSLEINKACFIGYNSRLSETIIIGDSHLISLAPALDKVLYDKKKSAKILIVSNCPPVINLHKWAQNFNCPSLRKEFKEFIKNSEKIKNVMIVGFWEAYVDKKDSLKLETIDESTLNTNASDLISALDYTLNWLIEEKKINVTLFGDVPIYKKSVPFMHAHSLLFDKNFPLKNFKEHTQKNEKLYKLVSKYKNNKNFNFIDLAKIMCNENCITNENKKSLYHDSNHLNLVGSLFLVNSLSEELKIFDYFLK